MPRRKSIHLEELKSKVSEPRSRHPHTSMIDGAGLYAGNGLYAGAGLYAGNGLVRNAIDDIERLGSVIKKNDHKKHHKSLTGHRLIGYGLPPALQSQPYSTNYQFGVTLPPAYQRIVRGNGLY